jgi:hypothetical protein
MRSAFPPFPNSRIDPFLITSPQTSSYNCIAWAFGDNSKWYWPDSSNIYFWPSDIPRQETLDSFIKLFESIGYIFKISLNHSKAEILSILSICH